MRATIKGKWPTAHRYHDRFHSRALAVRFHAAGLPGRRLGRLGDALRALGMDGAKALSPGFVENAHQVDHPVGALHRRHHRRAVAHIRPDRRDLANIAHRLEEQRALGVAHRDRDPRACRRQPLHQMAAQKTGTAEYGHHGWCHHALPSPGHTLFLACVPETRSLLGGTATWRQALPFQEVIEQPILDIGRVSSSLY